MHRLCFDWLSMQDVFHCYALDHSWRSTEGCVAGLGCKLTLPGLGKLLSMISVDWYFLNLLYFLVGINWVFGKGLSPYERWPCTYSLCRIARPLSPSSGLHLYSSFKCPHSFSINLFRVCIISASPPQNKLRFGTAHQRHEPKRH